jgi:hypothetical protein
MNVGQLFVMFGLQVNQQSWNRGMDMIHGLRRAAQGLIVGLGVQAITNIVEHATEAATHLVSMATAMGMTIEQTQEWGYVAEQSGSNLKELSVGMNMFLTNLRLYTEGRGSKVLRDRFREIGIGAGEAKKALAGPEGLQGTLFHIADKLKTMGGNGHEATFTQLFGRRAGRAMLADLERGSEGLKELMARRKAMGELDKEQALTLRNLGNRVKDLHTAWNAFASQAVAKLGPKLVELAERAMAWMQENRELLTGALEAAIKGVAAAFKGLGAIIGWVTDLIHEAGNGDTGAQAILIGIATAIMVYVVPALWAMVAPILAATAPFLAIAAAVAVVAYGILRLVQYIQTHTEQIRAAWNNFVQTASDAWDAVVDAVMGAVDSVVAFGQKIIDGFERAWAAVKKGASDALTWIADQFANIPGIHWMIEHSVNAAAGASGALAPTGLPFGGTGGISDAHNGPSAMWAGASMAPDGTVSGVNVGPTTVQINVNSVQEAKQAHDAFVQERDDNALRHAARGVAGEVR